MIHNPAVQRKKQLQFPPTFHIACCAVSGALDMAEWCSGPPSRGHQSLAPSQAGYPTAPPCTLVW